MKENLLDLYSDYLLSSFSYTTATGLSILTEGKISHDKVSKFLNKEMLSGKDLWIKVKPTIRKIESQDGVVIIDDTDAGKTSLQKRRRQSRRSLLG